MSLKKISRLLVASSLLISATALSIRAQNGYGRDAAQPLDDEYTKKIREYTTETFFNSPLTDYLPASPNVPFWPRHTISARLGCVRRRWVTIVRASRYLRVPETAMNTDIMRPQPAIASR